MDDLYNFCNNITSENFSKLNEKNKKYIIMVVKYLYKFRAGDMKNIKRILYIYKEFCVDTSLDIENYISIFPKKLENVDFQLLKNINFPEKRNIIKIIGKEYIIPRDELSIDFSLSDSLISQEKNIQKIILYLKKFLQRNIYYSICDLLNIVRFKNQTDFSGFHSYDDLNIDKLSVTILLFFGDGREIVFRRKNQISMVKKINFSHGDIMIMKLAYQEIFEHSILKSSKEDTSSILFIFTGKFFK